MEQILNERSREKRERLQLDRMARLEEEVKYLDQTICESHSLVNGTHFSTRYDQV